MVVPQKEMDIVPREMEFAPRDKTQYYPLCWWWFAVNPVMGCVDGKISTVFAAAYIMLLQFSKVQVNVQHHFIFGFFVHV